LWAVRRLTPAASAAAWTFHPSSSTRRQISALLFGQVRALAWSLIRARLSDRSFDNPDLPGWARVNNVYGALT